VTAPIRGRRGVLIPISESPDGLMMHLELDAILAEQEQSDWAERFLTRLSAFVWPILLAAVVVFVMILVWPRPPQDVAPAPMVTDVQLPTLVVEP
jgi:hypothetical protein